MRRVIGGDYRFLFPASALMGAIMLLVSDIVARMAVSPVILPIGNYVLPRSTVIPIFFKGVKNK